MLLRYRIESAVVQWVFNGWLLLAVAAAIALPSPAAAILVGEYSISPLNTTSGIRSGLAAASDGSIWFTYNTGNKVGRITADGQVTAFDLTPYGKPTGGIAAGSDGNMWVAKEFPGAVVRIAPDGSLTEFSVGTDSVGGLTAGADGNIWFVSGNKVGRLAPDGTLVYFEPPTPASGTENLALGSDGNVWFVEVAARQIAKITPSGEITEYNLTAHLSGNLELFNIAAGSDGNLWFTDSGRIGRITPEGSITAFEIPGETAYVYGISTGPDGNIWFVANNLDYIGRVTPTGSFLDPIPTPSAVAAPQHVASSPDGLIWFTESNTNKIGVIALADIADYFPLTAGTTWSFQRNGVAGFTRTVSSGTYTVGGTATRRIVLSDGSMMYMTNDSLGIRDHREYYPGPPATDVIVSPALVFASPQMNLGQAFPSNGTASGTQGGIPFSLPYWAGSTIEAVEIITVPAGTFRTVRLRTSVTISGSITQTNWVAESIGVVKTIVGDSTDLMTGTSIQRLRPDTFWFFPLRAVAPNTAQTSAPAVITGITAPAPVSVAGGKYRIDDGAFTTAAGTVANGQSIILRLTASSSFATPTTAVVTVGGVSAAFMVTTWPAPTDVSLADVIWILQVIAGQSPGGAPPGPGADADADGRYGLADLLHILQRMAGVRR
jgi:virginiamycin B lyase